jgi:PPM family protein phosphatase
VPDLRAQSAGLSDVGRVRTNNEDFLAIHPPLYIVADGMGGAAAGEVASRLAVNVIVEELAHLTYSKDAALEKAAESAFKRADNEIKQQAKSDPALSGMGTTAVVAFHTGDRIFLANVGDSRAYLITGSGALSGMKPSSAASTAQTGIMKAISDDDAPGIGRITRLTVDHSVVMEMVASGVIEEDDIRTHPLRNRITRCLGSIGNSSPDFYWKTVAPGDTLLLCSDGLWEMVYEDLLLAIVNSHADLDEVNPRLIRAANNAGGVDNITVVTVRFGE